MFSNVYVSLCGAALTAASYALLGQPLRLDAVAGVVFCCTLVIYNLDRLVEPHPGESPQERWVEQHRRPLWLITAFAGLASLLFISQLQMQALVSMPIAGAVALGYCLPVVPGRSRCRRLKELPGAKLLLIAAVWTYATAVLPMLQARVGWDGQAAAVLGSRFLFLAAVALPFDLPDMQRDRQSGIATLPNVLGVNATRWTAIGLACAAGLVGLFNPWPGAGAVVLSAGAAAALLLALRPDRGVLYFMVALDGLLLVQAGALGLLAVR